MAYSLDVRVAKDALGSARIHIHDGAIVYAVITGIISKRETIPPNKIIGAEVNIMDTSPEWEEEGEMFEERLSQELSCLAEPSQLAALQVPIIFSVGAICGDVYSWLFNVGVMAMLDAGIPMRKIQLCMTIHCKDGSVEIAPSGKHGKWGQCHCDSCLCVYNTTNTVTRPSVTKDIKQEADKQSAEQQQEEVNQLEQRVVEPLMPPFPRNKDDFPDKHVRSEGGSRLDILTISEIISRASEEIFQLSQKIGELIAPLPKDPTS